MSSTASITTIQPAVDSGIPVKQAKLIGRLVETREARGYNQAQTAALLGLSPTSYNLVERGKRVPKVPLILRFCEVFDVTPNWLLGFTDNGAPKEVLSKDALAVARQYDRLPKSDKQSVSRYLSFLTASLETADGAAGSEHPIPISSAARSIARSFDELDDQNKDRLANYLGYLSCGSDNYLK